jgi:peptide/nickel transport system substrate-binding protein
MGNLDALADEVQATFDKAERTKLLQHMHEMVVEDGGRVFIVHDLNPRALRPNSKVSFRPRAGSRT